MHHSETTHQSISITVYPKVAGNLQNLQNRVFLRRCSFNTPHTNLEHPGHMAPPSRFALSRTPVFLALSVLFSIFLFGPMAASGVESARNGAESDVYPPFVRLNVHAVMPPGLATAARALNANITTLAPHNEINLSNGSVPHVSLYLTAFLQEHEADVLRVTKDVARKFDFQQAASSPKPSPKTGFRCPMDFEGKTLVQGDYGMWEVDNDNHSSCLQLLSNALVAALEPFIVPNQPIPAWVKALPEPERSEKEAMIKKYGSPNVFSQFQPHLTLAWDSQEPLGPAFAQLDVQPMAADLAFLAIAPVGPHGTVPEGKNIAEFPLR
jgi:Protein of unknown function (DUF1045)